MDKSEYGVHQTHCCIIHGCKYGDVDCPVVLGIIKQEYLCEDCDTFPFRTTFPSFPQAEEEQEQDKWKTINEKFLKLNRKLKLDGLKG